MSSRPMPGGKQSKPGSSSSRRLKQALLALSILAVLVALALGAGGWWAWQELQKPYRGWAGEELVVKVEPGTGAAAILRQLEAEGVLADADLAQLYLIHLLGDPPLLAGQYRFDHPLTAPQVLDKLVSGDVLTHGVTVIEGLSLWETAKVLSGKGFGDYETFVDIMSSAELIADFDPQATSLEGYLFPSTYSFRSGMSEKEVVATLVRTFKQTWEKELRSNNHSPSDSPPQDGSPSPGPGVGANNHSPSASPSDSPPASPPPLSPPPRSLHEIVTLASIVEKEARLSEERPLIAGVYANRLRRGIALYADPTVIYALRLAERWDGNIRKPDLKIDSPYNTYVNAGLPPGPIASPGLESLRAAARPADVPYLYFVSRNDGSHVFAETLAEHNRNVDRWQKRYWRERWAEEKRQESEKPADDEAPDEAPGEDPGK